MFSSAWPVPLESLLYLPLYTSMDIIVEFNNLSSIIIYGFSIVLHLASCCWYKWWLCSCSFMLLHSLLPVRSVVLVTCKQWNDNIMFLCQQLLLWMIFPTISIMLLLWLHFSICIQPHSAALSMNCGGILLWYNTKYKECCMLSKYAPVTRKMHTLPHYKTCRAWK
jgi:hypothetical protein